MTIYLPNFLALQSMLLLFAVISLTPRPRKSSVRLHTSCLGLHLTLPTSLTGRRLLVIIQRKTAKIKAATSLTSRTVESPGDIFDNFFVLSVIVFVVRSITHSWRNAAGISRLKQKPNHNVAQNTGHIWSWSETQQDFVRRSSTHHQAIGILASAK